MIPKEKGDNDRILERNFQIVNKIDHYKNSKSRRFKFWLKAKWKAWCDWWRRK